MIDRRVRLLSLATILFAGLAAPGRSDADVLAQSRFDTDAESWVVKDLPYPNPGAPPTEIGTYTPTYNATGGNPGGYASMNDPTGNTWYWFAPAKFLGNKLGAYGGTLSFDLRVTGNGAPFSEEDIILVGGGVTVVASLPAPPGTSFTAYHLTLTEAGWKRDSPLGAPATKADMTTVLGSLTGIYIRGEYLLAMDDVGSIDNVVLEGAAPICDIELSQTTFTNGQQIVAQTLHLANVGAGPIAVELKLWLETPGSAPISVARTGADGSLVFPAGLDQTVGPIPLFTVSPATPRGTYAFSCRLVNPVTGATLTADLNPFDVQ